MQEQNAWVKKVKPEHGWYLAGFADGEGSFNVSLRQRPDHTMLWQVILTFNVSQKETYILSQFKRALGCGRLQVRKDGVAYFTVSNPIAIDEKVVPFFTQFGFWSQKKRKAFAIFKKIAKLVMEKKHLTKDGLLEIMRLREELNKGKGRTRKYNLHDVEESLKGNPQRLHARPRKFREEHF